MLLKADILADLLEAGSREDTADPFLITPTPDLVELRRSGSAAVDLRLGTWFSNLREARVPCLRVDDPVPTRQVAKTTYVPFGGEYVLHPGGFVLAATLEWIRLPTNLGAYVVGKSSWGRWGLIIATATGVHPGFKGCLTLELSNVGQIPVAVKPGIRICQLFVHDVKTNSERIDGSEFVGLRKPVFRHIKLDPLAALLGKAAPKP
jgi:dCTP deaminase